MYTKFKHVFLLLFSALLISCGGGGSSGIGGSGITSGGTITGFGSIFVNGVEYETGSSTITLNGEPVTEADLGLGMTVTVRGTLDSGGTTGTADTVEIISEVKGPISTAPILDGNTKSFSVYSYNVIVDKSATVFDGFSFDTIAQNDVIEASGYINSAGELIASRVELKGTVGVGSEVEVRGTIGPSTIISSNSFTLDVAGVTNALTITHDGMTDFSELTGGVGGIVIGAMIEVKGTYSTVTSITASKIEDEDDLLDSNDSSVELEGIITEFNSISDFKVNGQQVDASGAILMPTSLQLGNDVAVEVEGNFSNGVLIATEVESEEAEVKVEAVVSDIDVPNNNFTLSFASGQDVIVYVDTNTTMEDETGVIVEPNPFTINDIAVSDYIEVQGYIDTDDSDKLKALDVHRKIFDMNGEAVLEGIIESFDTTTAGAESVTILGVTYPSDGATVFSINNVVTTRANFLAQLQAGVTKVEVTDDYIAGSLDGVADEMEIEN